MCVHLTCALHTTLCACLVLRLLSPPRFYVGKIESCGEWRTSPRYVKCTSPHSRRMFGGSPETAGFLDIQWADIVFILVLRGTLRWPAASQQLCWSYLPPALSLPTTWWGWPRATYSGLTRWTPPACGTSQLEPARLLWSLMNNLTSQNKLLKAQIVRNIF